MNFPVNTNGVIVAIIILARAEPAVYAYYEDAIDVLLNLRYWSRTIFLILSSSDKLLRFISLIFCKFAIIISAVLLFKSTYISNVT